MKWVLKTDFFSIYSFFICSFVIDLVKDTRSQTKNYVFRLILETISVILVNFFFKKENTLRIIATNAGAKVFKYKFEKLFKIQIITFVFKIFFSKTKHFLMHFPVFLKNVFYIYLFMKYYIKF